MFVYPAHRQHVEERCESADKSATDLNKLLSLSQLNSQQSKRIGYTFRGVMQTRKRSGGQREEWGVEQVIQHYSESWCVVTSDQSSSVSKDISHIHMMAWRAQINNSDTT